MNAARHLHARLRRLLVLTALVLGTASHVSAAIAQDATAGTSAVTVASISWSHVTASGGVLVVTVGYQGASTTVAATYNSVSMTQLWNKRDDIDLQGTAGFVLHNPSTGSNTVAVTFGATVDLAAGGSVSYTGVVNSSAAATHRTVYTANESNTPGTTATVTVADSQSGDLVLNSVIIFSGAGITSGQTSVVEADPISGGSSAYGMGSASASGANTVMSWTSGGSFWAIGATSFIPSGGGGGGAVCGSLALLGVGCDAR